MANQEAGRGWDRGGFKLAGGDALSFLTSARDAPSSPSREAFCAHQLCMPLPL